jgi:hypothetical protein
MNLARLARVVLWAVVLWLGGGDARAQDGPALSVASGQTLQGAAVADASAAPAIYLTYNLYHADIILPRAALLAEPGLINKAVADSTDAPWILVGWGDHRFGRHSKILVLRLLNGLWALLAPNDHSILRIAGLPDPTAPVEDYGAVREINVSAAGMDRMTRRVDDALRAGPDGGPILADMAARPGESLFDSKETYFLFHQCNHWIGQILRAGGVRTTPVIDAIPLFLLIDLTIHGHAGRLLTMDHVPPLLRADRSKSVGLSTAAPPGPQQDPRQ